MHMCLHLLNCLAKYVIILSRINYFVNLLRIRTLIVIFEPGVLQPQAPHAWFLENPFVWDVNMFVTCVCTSLRP